MSDSTTLEPGTLSKEQRERMLLLADMTTPPLMPTPEELRAAFGSLEVPEGVRDAVTPELVTEWLRKRAASEPDEGSST